MPHRTLPLVLSALLAGGALAASPLPSTRPEVPGNLPEYRIEGRPRESQALRELSYLHYTPLKAGHFATLYDEWLTLPAIWPGTADCGEVRRKVAQNLSDAFITPDGYVSSMMHYSVAHPLGWPLPPGYWGDHAAAWHFSFAGEVPDPYRTAQRSTPEGWTTTGMSDDGVQGDGWHLAVNAPNATVTSPRPQNKWIDPYQAPFLLLIWRTDGVTAGARPYVEWVTEDRPDYSAERRVEVELPAGGSKQVYTEDSTFKLGPLPEGHMAYVAVPVYQHPEWKGRVTGIRIGLGNPAAGGSLTLQAVLTSFDTRHNINNPSFIHACLDYFYWTGDLEFLRHNLPRMRAALRFMQSEFRTRQELCVDTPWVGHEGRTGRAPATQPSKEHSTRPVFGGGIGSNYWDLLPFGGKDAFATIRYYDAVKQMARIERDVETHPQWKMPEEGRFDPAELEVHAREVCEEGNRAFWNAKTGRFVACVDADGVGHDYGYTFVNLEAIDYGFASAEHARQILEWLDGKRTVAGDTSTGADIYHWRFAPRTSTKRNLDWYSFWWDRADTVPFGGQVQDGGAVLAFSRQDIEARLKTLGPENAARRLEAIAGWFGEVEEAGGYRKYYNGQRDGTLQGGGPAGGLGMDHEFQESAMVTLPLLTGFLGFAPTADGFSVTPRLPKEWPALTITDIRFRSHTLTIKATHEGIEITDQTPGEVVPVMTPYGAGLLRGGVVRFGKI